MKRYVEKIPQGTHDHFSWFLPARLGRLTSFFLKFLFSGIRFEPEQSAVFEHLPSNAIFVLVSKHKSQLERLFFFTRPKGIALPCPEIGLCFRAVGFQPLPASPGYCWPTSTIIPVISVFPIPWQAGMCNGNFKGAGPAYCLW